EPSRDRSIPSRLPEGVGAGGRYGGMSFLRFGRPYMQVRWMANPARRGNTRRRGLVTPVLAAGALCLITISLTGCGESGPPRGSVQGFVTWEGTPVENGTISFIPLGDGVAASAPIVGGRYILPKD